jgi:hypothetical protein
VRLSTVATDIFGVSGHQIIEVLIASESDPEVLAKLARGRKRPKRATNWSNIGQGTIKRSLLRTGLLALYTIIATSLR